MKKNLEQIHGNMFRSLNRSEELAVVGGATTDRTTNILTSHDGLSDHIIDDLIDPIIPL